MHKQERMVAYGAKELIARVTMMKNRQNRTIRARITPLREELKGQGYQDYQTREMGIGNTH